MPREGWLWKGEGWDKDLQPGAGLDDTTVRGLGRRGTSSKSCFFYPEPACHCLPDMYSRMQIVTPKSSSNRKGMENKVNVSDSIP